MGKKIKTWSVTDLVVMTLTAILGTRTPPLRGGLLRIACAIADGTFFALSQGLLPQKNRLYIPEETDRNSKDNM